MGINSITIQELSKIFSRINVKGKSCLVIGVQDLRDGVNTRFKNQDQVFKSFGFTEVSTLSVFKKERPTYLVDLNYPTPLPRKFDCIIDIGSLEHCFCASTALSNLVSYLNLNGIIIHINPGPGGGWNDHGYQAYNLKFYRDFYVNNGFRMIALKHIPAKHGKKRLNFACAQLNICKGSIVFPTETKYGHGIKNKIIELHEKEPIEDSIECSIEEDKKKEDKK